MIFSEVRHWLKKQSKTLNFFSCLVYINVCFLLMTRNKHCQENFMELFTTSSQGEQLDNFSLAWTLLNVSEDITEWYHVENGNLQLI